MEPLKKFRRNRKTGPEAKIQEDFVTFLRSREWYVKETHGSIFQSGLPDLFTAHKRYGARWVEVKNPTAYRFTAAQIENFPKMIAAGVGIWIIVAATESEYKKLFNPCNLWAYFNL